MQQNTKAPEKKGKVKKTEKKKKKAKKKKGMSFNTFVSIFLILLIVAVVLVLYFDLLGSNQMLSGILGLDKPTQVQLDELETKRLELDTQETELNDNLFNYNQMLVGLEEKQSSLDSRESAIEKKEEELDKIQAEWDAKEKELDESIGMFELMDPEKAAAAIDIMKDDAAINRLLTGLSKEQAAKILNFMNYKVTADVLNLIMEEPVVEE